MSGIAGFLTGFITEGLNLMALPANIGRIDALLNPWRPVIGAAFDGYRNHVVRMASYCLLLKPCDAIEQQKIEIAACFHDIGIWTAGTLDYLPPSAAVAREYLGANALEAWSDEIARMIVTHHKLRPATDEASALQGKRIFPSYENAIHDLHLLMLALFASLPAPLRSDRERQSQDQPA